MEIPQDFKEFIELLNEHNVRYWIVGGYAVGFHSRPKFTQDLDIWIDNSEENARHFLTVLQEFGFGELDVTQHDLTNPDIVLQLGYTPLRIDIMTSVSGLEFADAYERKVEGKYLGVETYFISTNDLIENKKASGRKKAREDLEWIRKYA